MRTLVIDCATEACSVALFDDLELVGGDYRILGRGHAEQLIPMIAALPGRGRAARIAVALGPGSFTGVRVGLAAARGLALAWEAELVGYPTLDLVAAMARADAAADADGTAAIGVAMTGGHGEWFVAQYSRGVCERPLQSLPPGAAAQAIDAAVVAGSQAEALIALRGYGSAAPLWPDARRFQELPPAALRTAVAPLYGRAPDAKLPLGSQQ